jgi:chromosome segregation ATPase
MSDELLHEVLGAINKLYNDLVPRVAGLEESFIDLRNRFDNLETRIEKIEIRFEKIEIRLERVETQLREFKKENRYDLRDLKKTLMRFQVEQVHLDDRVEIIEKHLNIEEE